MISLKTISVMLYLVLGVGVSNLVFCSHHNASIFVSHENVSIIDVFPLSLPHNVSVAHELTPLMMTVVAYVQDDSFLQRFDRHHSSFREFAGPRAGMGYKAAWLSCKNNCDSTDCCWSACMKITACCSR